MSYEKARSPLSPEVLELVGRSFNMLHPPVHNTTLRDHFGAALRVSSRHVISLIFC